MRYRPHQILAITLNSCIDVARCMLVSDTSRLESLLYPVDWSEETTLERELQAGMAGFLLSLCRSRVGLSTGDLEVPSGVFIVS